MKPSLSIMLMIGFGVSAFAKHFPEEMTFSGNGGPRGTSFSGVVHEID